MLPLQTVHRRQRIDGMIKQKSVQPGKSVKVGPVLHTNVSTIYYVFLIFSLTSLLQRELGRKEKEREQLQSGRICKHISALTSHMLIA